MNSDALCEGFCCGCDAAACCLFLFLGLCSAAARPHHDIQILCLVAA